MRRALLAVILVAAAARLPAQPVVRITDLGPGVAGRLLRDALLQPHVLYVAAGDTIPVRLRRDSVFERTVIVLGRSATVSATVRGDVIVVGGDLYLHPGAQIDGRAVAIGGGVYNSTLAIVRGGRQSYRDETFDVIRQAPGVYALDYRALNGPLPPPVSLPGLFGVRFPTYDRVDGLSIPWGPYGEFLDGRALVDLTATYRSNLGAIDPWLAGHLALGRRSALDASLGRTTLSNDAWIWSDLVNSLSTFGLGTDTRNYYRADRAQASVSRSWEWATGLVEPFIGGAVERGWSTGPQTPDAKRPWSLWGHDSMRRILRPNPPVVAGTIVSALVGSTLHWENQGVVADLSLSTEVAPRSPTDARFVQTTGDASVVFPTFGTQRLSVTSHVVTTGGHAPPQRYAYLGGSGTLPTFRLLQFGGDELLFVDARYAIPLDRVVIRYVGAPTITLRYATGAAGVGRLPPLEQNVGAMLSVNLARVEYLIDPHTHRSNISFGLSVSR